MNLTTSHYNFAKITLSRFKKNNDFFFLGMEK